VSEWRPYVRYLYLQGADDSDTDSEVVVPPRIEELTSTQMHLAVALVPDEEESDSDSEDTIDINDKFLSDSEDSHLTPREYYADLEIPRDLSRH
jgi:hypothetical protein